MSQQIQELLNGFYDQLKKYEIEANDFAASVDKHIKALDKNPDIESLDRIIRIKEQKLKEFEERLTKELEVIYSEEDKLIGKCELQMDLIEKEHGEFSKVITNMTGQVVGSPAQSDIQAAQADASVKDDLSDISATAMASIEKGVVSWISLTRLCQEKLYMRLEKHEALLASNLNLITSFAELLKMKEELVHMRLEKHGSFLRSKQEVIKSYAELINSYIIISKGINQ